MEYTKKQIEELVKQSNSCNELITNIYGKRSGNNRRKCQNLIKQFDIDISHYKIGKYTKEILEPVVKNSIRMCDVVRSLGLKAGGGSQQFIKRKIKEFNIDCSHFIIGNKFTKSTRKTWREILIKKEEGSLRTTPYILRRSLVEMGRKYKCEGNNCIVSENWLGQPITLQVHHIDGDALNNIPDNLMLLCPNCHTQTNNWCNKNGKHGNAGLILNKLKE